MPWFRPRPRVTTPPEAIPLVVLGMVATIVAWLAIDLAGALYGLAAVLAPGGESLPRAPWLLAAGAAGLVLNAVLLVLGWKLVRRLTAGWVRRQPPDPLLPR